MMLLFLTDGLLHFTMSQQMPRLPVEGSNYDAAFNTGCCGRDSYSCHNFEFT